MYIRTKEDALDVLAAIVALPERREQIIQMNVKIMLCLDPAPRNFLSECFDTLIQNGLEYMRQKRQEAFAELQKEAPEAIILVDTSKDDLLEDVGTAMDALRMVNVCSEIFPDLARQYPPWRIGRTILAHEQDVRDALVQGVRLQGNARATELAPALDNIVRMIEHSDPWWRESAEAIQDACRAAIAPAGESPSNGAKRLSEDAGLLFSIIAMSDDRARLVLELLVQNKEEAQTYIAEIRKRLDVLQTLQERTADA